MSYQSTVNAFETTSATKNKKGKNFVVKEEKQLCWNFFHVSQDPTTSTNQRSTKFWDQIHELYNQNWPTCGAKWLAKSLETKRGMIKHRIAKFIGQYGPWWHFVDLKLQYNFFFNKKIKIIQIKTHQKSKFCFLTLLVLTKRCS